MSGATVAKAALVHANAERENLRQSIAPTKPKLKQISSAHLLVSSLVDCQIRTFVNDRLVKAEYPTDVRRTDKPLSCTMDEMQ